MPTAVATTRRPVILSRGHHQDDGRNIMAAKKAAGKKAAAKRSDEPTEISTQLREAVSNCGMSLPELAKAAGIDYAMLYRFSKGGDIRLETAGRIARTLGLRFCQPEK